MRLKLGLMGWILLSTACIAGGHFTPPGSEGTGDGSTAAPSSNDDGGTGGVSSVDLAGPADEEAPTPPQSVSLSNLGAATAIVSWTAATDNVGVVSYEVAIDSDAPVGVTGTSFNARNLAAASPHSVRVRAKDAAGNLSPFSNAVSFSTIAASGALPTLQGTTASVQVAATATSQPPSITLRWPLVSGRTVSSVSVFRKAPDATSWGAATSLAASATSYTDSNVTPGATYEYRVTVNGTANGFVLAGLDADVDEYKGRIVIVVDASLESSLVDEIKTLRRDLYGDGWIPIVQAVARDAEPSSVRNMLVSLRATYPDLRAAYLLGHVPVQYAGNNNPDGHGGRVMGSDGYYGELTSDWTASNGSCSLSPLEATLNEASTASRSSCSGSFPSTLELEVGRVDFYNLPAIQGSELTLLKGYLERAHRFKTRQDVPIRRALIKDFFENNGWNTAAAIWSQVGGLVGVPFLAIDNTNTTTSGTLLDGKSHLIHFGNYYGAGCTGSVSATIGDTATVAATNWGGVFNFVFGSYFGEFNCENSFLRAMLAKGQGLGSMYNGYNWFIHRMALGRTLGDAARVTQNNALDGAYAPLGNNAVGPAGNTHLSLMGDPSLRFDYIAPSSVLVHSVSASGTVRLDWSASPEPDLAGYHVYRVNADGIVRLTNAPLSTASYDTAIAATENPQFIVRAIKRVTDDAGSYYRPSVGVVSPSL